MGKLKISDLGYWELRYGCYITKMLLDYESLLEKDLYLGKTLRWSA